MLHICITLVDVLLMFCVKIGKLYPALSWKPNRRVKHRVIPSFCLHVGTQLERPSMSHPEPAELQSDFVTMWQKGHKIHIHFGVLDQPNPLLIGSTKQPTTSKEKGVQIIGKETQSRGIPLRGKSNHLLRFQWANISSSP